MVIALKSGFYATLNGRLYGPWTCPEFAQMGLETQLRLAVTRELGA